MKELRQLLMEIRDMLKSITERQDIIMRSVSELREENRKLKEEIRSSAYSVNNTSHRNQFMN
jgi:hypothetical protein